MLKKLLKLAIITWIVTWSAGVLYLYFTDPPVVEFYVLDREEVSNR